MQNMTTREFEQKYGSTIDDAALGIKPITGYDILKQFLAMDEKTENMLFSMLYYQDYEYNVKMGETTPIYDFNKFGRVYRVYLQAESEFREDISDLSKIFIKAWKIFYVFSFFYLIFLW